MLREQNEKRTRVAITTGGLYPIVDSLGGSRHSLFAGTFLQALRENMKRSASGDLYQALLKKFEPIMKNEGVKQMPERAGLYKSGHDGGDFIFNPVN